MSVQFQCVVAVAPLVLSVLLLSRRNPAWVRYERSFVLIRTFVSLCLLKVMGTKYLVQNKEHSIVVVEYIDGETYHRTFESVIGEWVYIGDYPVSKDELDKYAIVLDPSQIGSVLQLHIEDFDETVRLESPVAYVHKHESSKNPLLYGGLFAGVLFFLFNKD